MQAKGLFAFLMTLPDDWKIYKGLLHKYFKNGIKAVATTFKELEDLGYISKKAVRLGNGKFDGWKYTIIEKSTDLTEKGKAENRQVENLSRHNKVLTDKILSKQNTDKSTFFDKNVYFLKENEVYTKEIKDFIIRSYLENKDIPLWIVRNTSKNKKTGKLMKTFEDLQKTRDLFWEIEDLTDELERNFTDFNRLDRYRKLLGRKKVLEFSDDLIYSCENEIFDN